MIDLADLFAPDPVGPAQPMSYRQGTIVTFNSSTLSNTVDVGGAVLTDLPLLGVGEATLLGPGSVVGIANIAAPGGAATWAILGRLVTPGTAQAADAVGLLNSQVQAAAVATQVGLASAVWGDLLNSHGPTLDVTVRASGRLLVFVTAQIGWTDTASAGGDGGYMSVQMSGANTIDAATAAATLQAYSFAAVSTSSTVTDHQESTVTGQGVFAGLTPGRTTITAQYQAAVDGKTVNISNRTLTVITL